ERAGVQQRRRGGPVVPVDPARVLPAAAPDERGCRAALLLDPKSRLNTKVTIPEGWSAREVYAALAKRTRIPVSQFVAAARNPQALGAPAGMRTVEGLLFPATYDFDPGASPADMLKEMVGTFTTRVDLPTLNQAARAHRMNWYQMLTVASLL